MRTTILLLLFMPLRLLSQTEVRFSDTVTVSGYFYSYAWNAPYRVPEWKGAYAGDHRFVSDAMLGEKTILSFLQSGLKYGSDKEKFLSQMPDKTFRPFDGADTTALKWAAKTIQVIPFKKGDKAHKLGIDRYRAWVTRATIKWVRLEVNSVSALHGFDRPPSIDLAYARQNKWMNVYLPLAVLSLDRDVKWWSTKK